MSLDTFLPESLRGAKITRITQGLSNAGVYRVDEKYVLKITDEPLASWRTRVEVQRLAAEANVAPRIVHVDEERRAVVSERIVDRGFAARFGHPQTRNAAIEQLGQTLARVHALPLPTNATWNDPMKTVDAAWNSLSDFTLPTFAREAIERVLAEPTPVGARVLSHNDPNPSNVVFDGERFVLLDWDAAGPNNALYDLAAVALFLRMNDADASRLIAAHGGSSDHFAYWRRLVASVTSTMGFQVARRAGHVGGELRFQDAPTLQSVYAAMASGTLSLRTPDGLWAFALALVREAVRVG